MAVNDVIKTLRKSRGMTQSDLANRLGVVPTAVSAWEVGRNLPSIDVIKQLTRLFSVPIQEIIGNDYFGANQQVSKLNNDFLASFNKLNSRNKDDIRSQIYTLIEQQRYDELSKIVPLPKVSEIAISGIVSAGLGEYNEENFSGMTAKHYGDVPENYDFAALVNGDSMEPTFQDKQVIFVKQTKEAFNGQFVIAEYDHQMYIKRFSQNENGIFLTSLNKSYKKMPINDEHPLKIYGIVL